jgi:hypothetical protein
LDPLGTFYGHTVTFGRKKEAFAIYDELYNVVSEPTYDGLQLEIVHGQTTISYQAYVSSGTRSCKRIDVKTAMYTGTK